MQIPTEDKQITQVIYSVSELNQMVSGLLTDCFPVLKVTGEISNFSAPRSGHWYFSLKDAGGQVRCVFFQGQKRSHLSPALEGMTVLIQAQPRLYEHRGEFQLVVEEIERVGDGALQQAFEVLKRRLSLEGLFDPHQKKTLPALPRTIGVVTSPTGAAIRDILAVLKRRSPLVAVVIYPALVQGKQAADEIVHQLSVANSRAECEVLILARGGGSLEDLWAFNEERVARAIFASQIPILSAIGHEIDFTIADFVADIRAATPSAAAELVSTDRAIWIRSLEDSSNRLHRIITAHLEACKQSLMQLQKRLRHPKQALEDQWQRLDELEFRLQHAYRRQLQIKREQLAHLSRALSTISPLSTLARGYALVQDSNEKIIQKADQVAVGAILNIRLSQGRLVCTVTQTLF